MGVGDPVINLKARSEVLRGWSTGNVEVVQHKCGNAFQGAPGPTLALLRDTSLELLRERTQDYVCVIVVNVIRQIVPKRAEGLNDSGSIACASARSPLRSSSVFATASA